MWQEKLESLVKNHQDMLEQLEPDEVDKAEEGFQEKLKIDESDFYNHDAKRIFIPNSFDFQIESIGVFENNDICIKACDSLLSKLENIKKISEDGTIEVKIAETTLKNAYDIILQNEGYTIGKVIEYILHKQYYSGSKEYTFVGFRKDHPFDNYSRIRVAYNERVPNVSDTRVRQDIANACDVAIQIYGNIRNEFA